jgi:hypothetical protein
MNMYPKALTTTVTDALGRKVTRAVVWPDSLAPVIFSSEAEELAYDKSGVPAPAVEQRPQHQPSYLSHDWHVNGVNKSEGNR